MLIAIDHGNYAIKTPSHTFVSGLAEHTVKPPMAEEILEYDGRYWTLAGKRISYMRDKTQDDRFFILSLFAIAKELEAGGRYTPMVHLDLAVGLPPEHFGVLQKRFAQYFKRDGGIRFVYNEKAYTVFIDSVMVFPQAYAAVVPQGSQVVRMPRVFIVDIGGYTTDVLLLRNGKPDLQFCRSLESGIITMNNDIYRKVGRSARYADRGRTHQRRVAGRRNRLAGGCQRYHSVGNGSACQGDSRPAAGTAGRSPLQSCRLHRRREHSSPPLY